MAMQDLSRGADGRDSADVVPPKEAPEASVWFRADNDFSNSCLRQIEAGFGHEIEFFWDISDVAEVRPEG